MPFSGCLVLRVVNPNLKKKKVNKDLNKKK